MRRAAAAADSAERRARNAEDDSARTAAPRGRSARGVGPIPTPGMTADAFGSPNPSPAQGRDGTEGGSRPQPERGSQGVLDDDSVPITQFARPVVPR